VTGSHAIPSRRGAPGRGGHRGESRSTAGTLRCDGLYKKMKRYGTTGCAVSSGAPRRRAAAAGRPRAGARTRGRRLGRLA